MSLEERVYTLQSRIDLVEELFLKIHIFLEPYLTLYL